MRKILSIITVIILFTISVLVFWAGLAPKTFSDFWRRYPSIGQTMDKNAILSTKDGKILIATSSESITASIGRIIVNGHTWKVEIAHSEIQKEDGLSNRKALYNKKGMLFVFDRLESQSFWMKNMLIPIDMIFFDDQWRVVLIEKNVEPQTFPKTFGSGVKSKYILEVNASEAEAFGVKVGDQAIFLNK